MLKYPIQDLERMSIGIPLLCFKKIFKDCFSSQKSEARLLTLFLGPLNRVPWTMVDWRDYRSRNLHLVLGDQNQVSLDVVVIFVAAVFRARTNTNKQSRPSAYKALHLVLGSPKRGHPWSRFEWKTKIVYKALHLVLGSPKGVTLDLGLNEWLFTLYSGPQKGSPLISVWMKGSSPCTWVPKMGSPLISVWMKRPKCLKALNLVLRPPQGYFGDWLEWKTIGL